MLFRKNRLNRKKDFERVIKNGKGKKDRYLAIKFLENGLDYSRIGFVISRKIVKKATRRNLIKRRLRECFRKILPETKKGLDIVIFSLEGIDKLDFSQIKDNLENILQESNLLKKNVFN